MIGKEKLVFDTTATLSDNDNVGAYLRAADGTLITKTTDGSKERLDVANGAEAELGSAVAADQRANLAAVAVDPFGNLATLKVNADGELMADVSVTTGADKAEDAAHASGDIGSYVLSVRQDALASSTSADGDYQSMKTDSVGALWVRLSQGVALDSPNTAIAAAAVSVTDTETDIPSANLAARKKILLQNLGKSAIFVGPTGLDVTSGIRIAAGGNWEIEAGPGIEFKAIAESGKTCDVRVFEIA